MGPCWDRCGWLRWLRGFDRTPAYLLHLFAPLRDSPGSSIFRFLCKDPQTCIYVPSQGPGSFPRWFSVQGRARCPGLTAFIDKVLGSFRHPVSLSSRSFPKVDVGDLREGIFQRFSAMVRILCLFPGGR